MPIIAEKIGASHWQVEMLFTAYILTMAIMMLPAGISSRFGDKRMMTIGLAIVTVFAFICGMSQTIAQLSLFRWMGIRERDVLRDDDDFIDFIK